MEESEKRTLQDRIQTTKVMTRKIWDLLKKISIKWTLFSIGLFIFFLFLLFPYEKVSLFALHKKLHESHWLLNTTNFQFHFPLTYTAKEFSLKSPSQMNIDMYDFKMQASSSLLWQKSGQLTMQVPGLRIKQKDLFVRTNLKLVIDLISLGDKLSQTQAKISLKAQQMDFSDVMKLLQGNKKIRPFTNVLGDKIPRSLHFQQIQINGQLEKKRFKIKTGQLKGEELIVSITGHIDIRQHKFSHSRLFLNVVISHTSPIWAKLETEKSLLKGLGFLNNRGDLRLPIRGLLGRPKVSLPKQKNNLLFNPKKRATLNNLQPQ